jgi:molybdopterin-guanine dinucleotide biosynthesis adapter protein
MRQAQKTLGITGWKNSGKTTLVEKLVANLVARGYRIATIKHAHHAFDIDHQARDSWRHRNAGASEVAIVSSKRWAIIHELEHEQEPPFLDVLAKLAPCDLVIVEGYKREGHVKIEVRRKGANGDAPLAPMDPAIIAIVSEQILEGEKLPVFQIDEIDKIAAFVMERFFELEF